MLAQIPYLLSYRFPRRGVARLHSSSMHTLHERVPHATDISRIPVIGQIIDLERDIVVVRLIHVVRVQLFVSLVLPPTTIS